MIKSLLAGAAALGLIATAALAQEAYDSSTSRTTTTVTAPVPVVPERSTTTVQKSYGPYGSTVERSATTTGPVAAVNPNVFDPSRSSYHEERTVSSDGQVIDKSSKTVTASPAGRTSTYSETTTRTNE